MNIADTALLLVDLQNDFIHPNGAYARGGQANADIAALPARLKPLDASLPRQGRAGGGDTFHAGAGPRR